MFQSVKHFQSKSLRSGGSSGPAKSFRDNLRMDGLTMGLSVGPRASIPSKNDAELPGCWQLTKEHMKRELWSYIGLLGVFCIYFGVLVCVYVVKGVLSQGVVMVLCGVLLTGLGALNLLVSWTCYRYHKRHRRPSCLSGEDDQPQADPKDPGAPPKEKTRPRGHSLAGFLTPEFAKYAEFSARDRRYDNKRPNFFRAYDPTQISISFAHKYWMEQQKPMLLSAVGNPSFFPGSVPLAPINFRTPRSNETKRKLLDDKQGLGKRRQLST